MSETIIKKEQYWRTNTTLSQDLETLEINPYKILTRSLDFF